jgi:hypothetical protein
MRWRSLAVCLVHAVAASATAQVVINEFSYDDPAADDEEFVELYNTTSSPVDIGNWQLVGFTGDTGLTYFSNTVPAGTSIPAHGYYVFTFSGVTLAAFPAGFVSNRSVAANLENGDADGLLLRDSFSNIIDAIAYDCGDGMLLLSPADFPPSRRLFGGWNGTGATRTASASDYSIGRISDGQPGDAAEVFTKFAASPGTSNNTPAFTAAMPCGQSWNLVAGVTDPRFWGRGTDPRAVDPVSNAISQAPGASPGGGFAGVYCDTGFGGGESTHFNMAPLGDFQFEALVYLEATVNAAAGENYAFDLGIGCTDEFFQYSTPAGYGTSGLYWAYRNNGGSAGATLELRETLGPVVPSRLIGGVALSSNGWQRVFLRRQGSNVLGIVGGTYGSTLDGAQLTDSGANATAKGVFFTGYREVLSTNNKWLWIDDVSLSVPAANIADWTMLGE